LPLLNKDLVFYDRRSDEPIVVTVAQIEQIIADNEEGDVIGVQEDIQAIVDANLHGSVPLYVYIESLDPFMIWAGNNKEALEEYG